MKKATVYYTKVQEHYSGKNMEHMLGEELLRKALFEEYGKKLEQEPRSRGEYGKPFFTRLPEVHYNISHSGRWIYCILAPVPVGIDVQQHKKVSMERILRRMVPEEEIPEILEAGDPEKAFFNQWVLRESYVKWTGQGLSTDLRSLPLERGWYTLFSPEPGYSGCICSTSLLSCSWKEVVTDLPEKKNEA